MSKQANKHKIAINIVGNKPIYATKHSAGADLVANIEQNMVLKPMQRLLLPTGLFLELPIGYEAQVRSRSGLALKNGVVVLNSPGTIDSDYRGEVGVILINLGNEDFVIEPQARLAQLVICPIVQAEFRSMDCLSDLSYSERGENGFGSSNLK